MRPQGVDFNGDGCLDIVAGTFDGSPHVAFGSEKGFAQPVQILDKEGKRILFNQYWDDDEKKWIYPDSGESQHCTSAFAYDWDGDGDFDLLLGDRNGGRVYLRLNEGSNQAPLFGEENLPVLAEGKALEVPNKLASLAMVDWNRDGRPDLLCGTDGKTRPVAGDGELWVFPDTSPSGKPRFGKGEVIYRARPGKPGVLCGPGAGFYFDATDCDGDGDLDLLIGGKATLLPVPRELDEAQRKRLAEVKALFAEKSKAQRAIITEISKAAGDQSDERWGERFQAERRKRKAELDPLSKAIEELRAEQLELEPAAQTKNLVWLLVQE